MAKKAFSGDFVHSLPKGRMEAYRLWFEYLKLAHQIMPSKVNHIFYERWGDVANSDFKIWWEKYWQTLFTVPACVTLVASEEDYISAAANQENIIVQIKREGTTTQKLSDLKTLLDQQFGKTRKGYASKAAFEVTAKRSLHYPSLRRKLRFLQFFIQKKTIEAATLHYEDWSRSGNAKAGSNPSKRTAVPRPILRFAEELKAHQEEIQRKGKAKKSKEYNIARSDVERFRKSAMKILENTAKGQFPGRY